jgi:hypothetical protein
MNNRTRTLTHGIVFLAGIWVHWTTHYMASIIA